MKKLYTLLIAVLVAATASAQVSVRDASDSRLNRQPQLKGVISQSDLQKTTRGTIADEVWIYYPSWDASYWSADTITDGFGTFLYYDSVARHAYTNAVENPGIYAVAQTYDFTSYFYDDLIGEGSMSLRSTNSINIDSLWIRGFYFRDADYEGIDTLIISVLTLPADAQYYTFGNSYPNTCHLACSYNMNTGETNGAQKIIKLPLDASMISQPAEGGGYYYMYNYVDLGMTNVTDKFVHVAYTFKAAGFDGPNDTLKSNYYTFLDISADPNYFILLDDEARCSNMSHGMLNMSFLNSAYNADYYPMFALGQNNSEASFPDGLSIKVSCSECAIVNVPTVEKNNPTIYPNPATDKFQINLEEGATANVQMFNLLGQQVYSGVVNGTATINTNNLNSGVYMLKINQNGKVYTSKVIVK